MGKSSLLNAVFKRLITITILALLVVLVWNRLITKNGIANLFKAKPVLIEETPLLITGVKQIAELQTAKLYCEVVVDSIILTDTDLALNAIRNAIFSQGGQYFSTKKIVMVVRGKIIAGMDLARLGGENIRTNRDSVWVNLPAAQILEIITNPSDFDIFLEEGSWKTNEIQAVKHKAIRKMQDLAAEKKLIELANTRAKTLMGAFLKSAGFSFVNIQINQPA